MKKELVCDITDLPSEIRELIYEKYADSGVSNGCYKTFYVHDEQKPRAEHSGNEILHVDEEIDYIVERGDDLIADYFYDNEGLKNREEITLKIWW